MRFIKEVFPKVCFSVRQCSGGWVLITRSRLSQATVSSTCTSPSMVVTIVGPGGDVLCEVGQRQLYRKNGWTAKTEIVNALQAIPLDTTAS